MSSGGPSALVGMGVKASPALASLLDLSQELEHRLFGVEDASIPGPRLVIRAGRSSAVHAFGPLLDALREGTPVHALRVTARGISGPRPSATSPRRPPAGAAVRADQLESSPVTSGTCARGMHACTQACSHASSRAYTTA